MEDLPADLKFINTYLQRSKELKDRDPVISYYCKLYAVKLAIQKENRSPEAKKFLINLMNLLEEKTMMDQEAISNEAIGFAHVENFALKIFLSADNEDLNAGSTKKTAKTFLAASVFLELLHVFDEEVDDEIKQKIKYAKFKAADIMKALKEGRTPTRGSGTESAEHSLPPISQIEPLAPSLEQEPSFPQIPSVPVVPPLPPTSPQVPDLALVDDPDEMEDYNEDERLSIMQAGKFSKFAMSALLYDDVSTAELNLEKALALLRPLRRIK